MSDTTPTLSVGITTDIGPVAKLADDALGLVSQPIKSAQLDKPINEAKDRTAQYEDILSESDPLELDADLGSFISKLQVDAGFAAGELSGATRNAPVEQLNVFVEIAIAYIRLKEQVAIGTAK